MSFLEGTRLIDEPAQMRQTSDGFQKLAELTDVTKKFHASMDKVRAKMKELDEKEELRALVQALSKQNAELREALEAAKQEAERLREWLGKTQGDHSHQCINCHHAYTPGPNAETEDCPRCGCDGTKEWLEALSAANKGEKDG